VSGSARRRITVVGGGVIGLSIASRLREDGYGVEVVADQPPAQTVSAVAGAVWFPHLIDTGEAAIRQLRAARARFVELADDRATGVAVRTGTLVERRTDADRAWTAAVDGYELLPAAELPPGATAGVRVALPVIDMGRYLVWLHERCRDRGVAFTAETVASPAQLADRADVIVVAAGLRSPALLGDDDRMYPVRGQVLRLHNPGLTEWLVDDENPAGMLYVIPRIDDIVVGGTSERGRTDLDWDAEAEAAILERAIAARPELAGLPIVSRAVGLRPARPALRVETVAGWPIPVIACYGHGGAGVTASWGSADAVVDLVRSLT
jgi:D-amino-acid oxidase